jgi:hypothetical protein
MRNLIKKILREGDWDFINDFSTPEELFTGAIELQNGYHWSIDSFDDFKLIYNKLNSISGLKPKWVISPDFIYGEKYFNSYLNNDGNFNMFLPYTKENVYGWFDKMTEAYDKNDNPVNIPI